MYCIVIRKSHLGTISPNMGTTLTSRHVAERSIHDMTYLVAARTTTFDQLDLVTHGDNYLLVTVVSFRRSPNPAPAPYSSVH